MHPKHVKVKGVLSGVSVVINTHTHYLFFLVFETFQSLICTHRQTQQHNCSVITEERLHYGCTRYPVPILVGQISGHFFLIRFRLWPKWYQVRISQPDSARYFLAVTWDHQRLVCLQSISSALPEESLLNIKHNCSLIMQKG